MNEDHFLGGFLGIMIGFAVMFVSCLSADNPRETQAIEYGYAEFYEGHFMWKPDIEKRNMMKDYEFFKRNLKTPDVKIDNSPFTKL